jgi:hypothetical protein
MASQRDALAVIDDIDFPGSLGTAFQNFCYDGYGL